MRSACGPPVAAAARRRHGKGSVITHRHRTSRLLRKFGPFHDKSRTAILSPGGRRANGPASGGGPPPRPGRAPAPAEDDEQQPPQQRERREDQHDAERPPVPMPNTPRIPTMNSAQTQERGEADRAAHRAPPGAAARPLAPSPPPVGAGARVRTATRRPGADGPRTKPVVARARPRPVPAVPLDGRSVKSAFRSPRVLAANTAVSRSSSSSWSAARWRSARVARPPRLPARRPRPASHFPQPQLPPARGDNEIHDISRQSRRQAVFAASLPNLTVYFYQNR